MHGLQNFTTVRTLAQKQRIPRFWGLRPGSSMWCQRAARTFVREIRRLRPKITSMTGQSFSITAGAAIMGGAPTIMALGGSGFGAYKVVESLKGARELRMQALRNPGIELGEVTHGRTSPVRTEPIPAGRPIASLENAPLGAGKHAGLSEEEPRARLSDSKHPSKTDPPESPSQRPQLGSSEPSQTDERVTDPLLKNVHPLNQGSPQMDRQHSH